jgi:hypothetical protein
MKNNKPSTPKVLQKTKEIALPIGNRLSESLQFLPSGIIDKTYTGIGGTSLELDCNRNSIVVVPYNNIADIKATHLTIGNRFQIHKYKKSSETESDIDDYIKYVKEKGQPIKIICVNDQLVHLRSELTSAGIEFKSMFMLFDEIDSMQEQSSFRSVMDTCMEVYLDHPETQRAMISATISNFSHPRLAKELKYKIISPRRKQTALGFIHAHNVEKEAIAQVKAIVTNDDGKIVIACNHLNSALVLAKTLEQEDLKKSIGILCSSTSKSKNVAEKFFQKLGMDGILPSQINIITAAYFNGCDIHEKYHSIILSSISKASLQLSPSTIYQVSGRGRKGLLSNILIAKTGQRMDGYKIYSKDELIGFASKSADIRKGLKIMTQNNSQLCEDLMYAVHGLLVEGTKKWPALFRYKNDTDFDVSYFKIDQRLIEQNTVQVMSEMSIYIDSLKVHFDVHVQNGLNSTTIELEKTNKQEVVADLYKELEAFLSKRSYKITIKDLIVMKEALKQHGLKEHKLISGILELAVTNKWDLKKVFSKMKTYENSPRINAMLSHLSCELHWFTLNRNINLLNIVSGILEENEPTNEDGYTMSEMKSLEKKIIKILLIHKKLVAVKYTQLTDLLTKNPTFLREIVLDTTKTTQRVKGKGTRLIKVNGFRTSTLEF